MLYKVLLIGGNIKVNSYIDAAYAVHNDCKGQRGCIITIGRAGSIYCKSRVQKLSTKSSTECELVAQWSKYSNREDRGLCGCGDPCCYLECPQDSIISAEFFNRYHHTV